MTCPDSSTTLHHVNHVFTYLQQQCKVIVVCDQENTSKSKTSTRAGVARSSTSTTADVLRPLSSVARLTNQTSKSVTVINKTSSSSCSRHAAQFWKVLIGFFCYSFWLYFVNPTNDMTRFKLFVTSVFFIQFVDISLVSVLILYCRMTNCDTRL